MSPYRTVHTPEVSQLVQAAYAAARAEFASHPSTGATHNAMAMWICNYLKQHGVSSDVVYISHVGGDPKTAGVFRVYVHPKISDVEFEVMVS